MTSSNNNLRRWDYFVVGKQFKVINSKPYHKKNLEEINETQKSIPYITRTNKNNGVENVVKNDPNFKINPKNTIVFGAENATFFYQPFDYITGNKLYFIKNENINKYSGLFLQNSFNISVKDCGFNYGQGLTGTREKRRYVALPLNDKDEPDYQYMENVSQNIYTEKQNKYIKYIENIFKSLNYKYVEELDKKKWKDFFLTDIFIDIQRGKRLTKSNQIEGNKPYVSSSGLNNGVDNFIGNENKVRIFTNCLSLANSGTVGSTFYHPYNFVASDHITHLKNEDFNEYIYLFLSTMISRLSEKYNFNREINDKRISREKIFLPVNNKDEPDYEYMKQYIINLKHKKIKQYLDYLKNSC